MTANTVVSRYDPAMQRDRERDGQRGRLGERSVLLILKSRLDSSTWERDGKDGISNRDCQTQL